MHIKQSFQPDSYTLHRLSCGLVCSHELHHETDAGWFDHGSMDEADTPPSTPRAPPSSTPSQPPDPPGQNGKGGSKQEPVGGLGEASGGGLKDGREQSWMQYIPEAKPRGQDKAKLRLDFAEPQTASLDLTSEVRAAH